MKSSRVVIIGAGIGGLAASLVLARHGYQVSILEKARGAGGKLRQVALADRLLDVGPTVFTMRWVFDALFEAAGTTFDEHVTIRPMQLLARHAWGEDAVLDLHADLQQSADAIGEFAGADDARGFLDFSRRARRIYQALAAPFIGRGSPSLPGLVGHHLSRGWRGLGDLSAITPFATLSCELATHFRDPRLRQLFGRYATYCGSSPFAAPATLMLIAHVEQLGVWDVQGGMGTLAVAMERLAIARGVQIHYGACATSIRIAENRAQSVQFRCDGREDSLTADAVFCNADANALGSGSLGTDATMAQRPTPVSARSLSALTWNMVARTGGFPMHRHNVFFSQDYHQEFIDIFERGHLPAAPTVYVCAQDRGDSCSADGNTERLLVLVNAPPNGDTHEFSPAEVAACKQSTMSILDRCGLSIDWNSATTKVTTPNDWNHMFPTTGGALYGRASHGWRASFQRPGVRSRIANLYQTGGSVHPGPGVAMAALSGQQAAAACMEDHRLIPRSRLADTPGGMSTP